MNAIQEVRISEGIGSFELIELPKEFEPGWSFVEKICKRHSRESQNNLQFEIADFPFKERKLARRFVQFMKDAGAFRVSEGRAYLIYDGYVALKKKLKVAKDPIFARILNIRNTILKINELIVILDEASKQLETAEHAETKKKLKTQIAGIEYELSGILDEQSLESLEAEFVILSALSTLKRGQRKGFLREIMDCVE